MLEPDHPQAAVISVVGLLSDRVTTSRQFGVGGARATDPMQMAAPKALARLKTADVAWDSLSDRWPQHGVMGMEAA